MIDAQLKGTEGSYRHIHFAELDSTNTWLMDKARQGEAGNLWVTCDKQIAGKGSRGRDWVSQNGNLFASILLIEPAPLKNLAQLTFVSSLAVHDAISKFIGERVCEIKLKWPNDVLIDSKKCSGILLESSQCNGLTYVVIGFGINCNSYPEQTKFPSTSLKEIGIDIDAQSFFLALAETFAIRLKEWNSGINFRETRDSWLENAFGIGRDVTVQVPGKEIQSGCFASIDDSGYMMLELMGGTILKISTADLFFLPTSGQGN